MTRVVDFCAVWDWVKYPCAALVGTVIGWALAGAWQT